MKKMIVTSISIGQGKIPEKALAVFHKNLRDKTGNRRRKRDKMGETVNFFGKNGEEFEDGFCFRNTVTFRLCGFKKEGKMPPSKRWELGKIREIWVGKLEFSTFSTGFSTAEGICEK